MNNTDLSGDNNAVSNPNSELGTVNEPVSAPVDVVSPASSPVPNVQPSNPVSNETLGPTPVDAPVNEVQYNSAIPNTLPQTDVIDAPAVAPEVTPGDTGLQINDVPVSPEPVTAPSVVEIPSEPVQPVEPVVVAPVENVESPVVDVDPAQTATSTPVSEQTPEIVSNSPEPVVDDGNYYSSNASNDLMESQSQQPSGGSLLENQAYMANSQPVGEVTPLESNIQLPTNQPEEKIVKKKSKFKVFIIIILLLLIGAGVYYYMNNKDDNFITNFIKGKASNNPKTVFNNLLDHFDGNIEMSNYTKQTNKIAVTIDPASNSSLKKLEFNLNGEVNQDLMQLSSTFDLSYNGKTGIKGNAYIADGKIYLKIPDALDKYICLNSDLELGNIIEVPKVSDDIDLSEFIKDLFGAVKSSLKDDYFSSSKEENLTVSTLKITGEDFDNFSNDVINNLRSNSKYKDLIDEAAVSSNEITKSSDDEGINISVYSTSNGSVAKIIIIEGDATITIDNIIQNGFDFEVKTEEESFSGKIFYKVENEQSTFKLTLNFDLGTIQVNVEQKAAENVESVSIPSSEVVSANDLSDEDSMYIQFYLSTNETILSLINDLSVLGLDFN